MRHGPLLCFGVLLATTLGVCVSAPPAAAQNRAKSPAGTLGIISGVVALFAVVGTLYLMYGTFPMLNIISVAVSVSMAYRISSG